MRPYREREQADRVLPPVPRLIARKIIDAEGRVRNLRAIVNTHGQNGGRRSVP